ncbi:hypothetical protein YM75_000659 [Salmonella enterica subsp. enterica serovar Emek]|nr:hypothetical protein [Salmonella enterica subsp. enterica serovar Emek]EEB7093471.1 hypothetical protein [Salmonella enterica]EDQ2970142.1 hypothetical protein [Salmonella enterica subsp. enterica serovar Emek]EDQ5931718.1 hypothetical protein [Salmonella enterica subsp. enterica serovar Emek]EDS8524855.1 hypothetical protein [Salmonella enterica subsp. enterica serovar Emek]
MNVACDGPSGRGPWMGRVIRSQHISNLKYEGYKQGRGVTPPLFVNNVDASTCGA